MTQAETPKPESKPRILTIRVTESAYQYTLQKAANEQRKPASAGSLLYEEAVRNDRVKNGQGVAA